MKLDEAYTNLEFTRPADKLIGIIKNELAKKGNKSATKQEVLEIAKKILESRS